ncbi:MAG: glycosyl transferase, partial [Paracoccaceae bacterium]
MNRQSSKDSYPWIIDIEAKIVREEACYDAVMALKKKGFSPEIILAY